MTEAEKYLFDVHGYLVIGNALTTSELDAANRSIDAQTDQIELRPNDLARGSEPLKGLEGRGDLGGLLTWEKPHCEIFRELMALPKFTPYLEELLGPGFRLEAMSAITMNQGAEGFWFHEGAEPHDRSRGFLYQNGRMFCGMTNIAIQLTDVGAKDGGFACLPGSHKANFPCPDEIRLYHEGQDRIKHLPAKAGDAILFVECLMHGALPWTASHQRRTILVRYQSGVVSEGLMGAYTPPPFYDELTKRQKAVISAPQYRQEDKGSKLYGDNK